MATPELSDVVDDGTVSSLVTRYDNLKILDGHRNALVEVRQVYNTLRTPMLILHQELLARYSIVSEQLTQERADVDRERKWVQENDEKTKQNIAHLQNLLNRDPFILVLIDGEDLIFRNSFLRDGDLGGRRAAQLIHQAVNEHAFSSIKDLPVDVKVVVRMFVDLDTFAQTCITAGIVDGPGKIKTFARGFNQDKALFDITNVGSFGRETVIDKVEGLFTLLSSNEQD